MSAANILDEIDYRILRVARDRPGAGSMQINDGKTRGTMFPLEDRWVQNNARAGRVYMLRREGYLEEHTQERPGLYITEKGRVELAVQAAV